MALSFMPSRIQVVSLFGLALLQTSWSFTMPNIASSLLPRSSLAQRFSSHRPGLRSGGNIFMIENSGGGIIPFNDGSNPDNVFYLMNNMSPANTDDFIWTDKSAKKGSKGSDKVVSVPINGESVPVAQIRPKMGMIFTCKVCDTRQTRQFSKLAYEKGIVIVKCKGCDKRHLIADNLGWYKDWLGKGNSNIEELMESRGQSAKRLHGKAAASIWAEWYEEKDDKDNDGM